MIIVNGYIRFIYTLDVGIDETTGHPIPSEERLGCAIPCQYVIRSQNYLSRSSEGESVKTSGYHIYLEGRPCDCSERLQLCDTSDNVIGTYSIIMLEPLEAVGQTRLTV